MKDGKILKRAGRRASSPPVSPVAGLAEQAAKRPGDETAEEKELARIRYNRQSAKLSAARRASKLSELMMEQEVLEAAYQARLAQVEFFERVIAGARWANAVLPSVEI